MCHFATTAAHRLMPAADSNCQSASTSVWQSVSRPYNYTVKDLVSLSVARIKHLIWRNVVPLSECFLVLLCLLCVLCIILYIYCFT